MLPCRSGLFGPLRSPGRLVLGLDERFLVPGAGSLSVDKKKKERLELMGLFLRKGDR